ncbi:MAG: alcohol dehydrogenase [Flammeovirgaceae bacterium]|nr:alcohol dehydrogenase [Flammeovirgaceae bacterium]MBE63780.1 alcohol dehydrogenase [Flammeovirgaceae bacterium]
MKALVVKAKEGQYGLDFVEKSIPELENGYCLIKMKAAALNRRDYWISVGKYPGILDQVTLGSDGCGEVVAGSDLWKGQTVLINPNQNWGDDPDVQSSKYTILGTPLDGTLAEYLLVPEDRLVVKPDHLTDEEGAAIPLAALTAFRAVFTKANIQAGSKVLVTGIGGGVSHYALMFAQAIGAEVYVNSSSDEKLNRALSLGAKGIFNYRDEDWVKQASEVGKFDAVIDSAGGNAINNYLRLIKPGGKIVVYGSTTGKTEGLDLFRLFWSQVSLVGSTMGNDDEFQEMIQFVTAHQIKPSINKVYSFEDGIDAINSMSDAEQFGKTIIKF